MDEGCKTTGKSCPEMLELVASEEAVAHTMG